MRGRVVRSLLALALVAAPAAAQDDAWKELAARYEELARNHDDEANRERRYVLIDMFPFRADKACRKLLREALDEERELDNRVSVVHLLAGCGDGKAFESLLGELKKDRVRAPFIAIGEGLGFTPDADRADLAERVAKHLAKAKDDLRLSLLEGLGLLGRPESVDVLLGLKKMGADEWFERNLALGRCGGEAVVPRLVEEAGNPLPEVRLGAALGLAATRCDKGFEALRGLLTDPDARVVRAAAEELTKAERKEAAAEIAHALGNAVTLRTREDLRGCLVKLLGRDLGYDAAAWTALAKGGDPKAPDTLPRPATIFGAPVASDTFALLFDTSRSMEWQGRLDRAKQGSSELVRALPDEVAYVLADVSRVYEPSGEGYLSGAAGREQALAWIDGRLTRNSCDLKLGLTETLTRFPLCDTIVVVTDSHPWGTGRAESSRETMEVFRRLNRTRRVRLVVALVMPGGRYEASERSEPEYLERIEYLKELAEESGGTFVNVAE